VLAARGLSNRGREAIRPPAEGPPNERSEPIDRSNGTDKSVIFINM
jgi:hypothetical protein